MKVIEQIPLKWKIYVGASIVLTIIIGFILYKKKKEADLKKAGTDVFNRAPSLLTGGISDLFTDTGTSLAPPPSSVTTGIRDPRPLVNQIYEELNGPNLMVYPEIVNRLVNVSKEELVIAYDYFNEEYGGITGETLYTFIKSEWGSEYDPALERLERHNLT